MKSEKKTAKPVKRILGVKKDTLLTIDKNDFGAILENLSEKFDIIIEGQQILTDRVDRNEISINNLTVTVNNLETRFNDFEDNMNSKFQTVFDYLSRIDDELQEIKSRLDKLTESKAEKKEVIELTNRVSRLEKELFEIRKDIREKVKQ